MVQTISKLIFFSISSNIFVNFLFQSWMINNTAPIDIIIPPINLSLISSLKNIYEKIIVMITDNMHKGSAIDSSISVKAINRNKYENAFVPLPIKNSLGRDLKVGIMSLTLFVKRRIMKISKLFKKDVPKKSNIIPINFRKLNVSSKKIIESISKKNTLKL